MDTKQDQRKDSSNCCQEMYEDGKAIVISNQEETTKNPVDHEINEATPTNPESKAQTALSNSQIDKDTINNLPVDKKTKHKRSRHKSKGIFQTCEFQGTPCDHKLATEDVDQLAVWEGSWKENSPSLDQP